MRRPDKRRDIVRLVTPPIVFAAAHRLRRRLSGALDGVPLQLQGPYAGWAEAAAAADGWEAPAILESTRKLSDQVRHGAIAFQQDAVAHAQVRYSPVILALIALVAAREGGRIDLIDIGGALGTNFQQNRKVLAPFLARGACRWRVAETPALAALGRAEFEEPGLTFFDSWGAAVDAGGPPAGALFSGSFQYMEGADALLGEIAAAGVGVVAFDRMLLTPGHEERYFVQHPGGAYGDNVTLPVRTCGREAVIERMAGLGFERVETFPGPRAGRLRQPSMLFARGT